MRFIAKSCFDSLSDINKNQVHSLAFGKFEIVTNYFWDLFNRLRFNIKIATEPSSSYWLGRSSSS